MAARDIEVGEPLIRFRYTMWRSSSSITTETSIIDSCPANLWRVVQEQMQDTGIFAAQPNQWYFVDVGSIGGQPLPPLPAPDTTSFILILVMGRCCSRLLGKWVTCGFKQARMSVLNHYLSLTLWPSPPTYPGWKARHPPRLPYIRSADEVAIQH